jgi:hypothetical protein
MGQQTPIVGSVLEVIPAHYAPQSTARFFPGMSLGASIRHAALFKLADSVGYVSGRPTEGSGSSSDHLHKWHAKATPRWLGEPRAKKFKRPTRLSATLYRTPKRS